MQVRVPKVLAGGLAATALVAALGGAAVSAQTASPTPSARPPAAGTPRLAPAQRHEEFLNAFASKLGKTPAEVRAALIAVQKERVQAEVTAGRLTQAQADEIVKRIEAGGGIGPFGSFGKGPGFGHGPRGRGPWGPGGFDGPGPRPTGTPPARA